MTCCAHPNCNRELEGRYAFACTNHYFALDPLDARILTGLKIKAGKNPAMRDHLESQLEFYISNAFKRAKQKKESICVS